MEIALKQAAQDYTRDNVEQQRYQERMKMANMRQDIIFQNHYNAVYLAGREREMKEKLKLEEQQKAVKETMNMLEQEQRAKIGIAKREYNHMLQNQIREKQRYVDLTTEERQREQDNVDLKIAIHRENEQRNKEERKRQQNMYRNVLNNQVRSAPRSSAIATCRRK